MSNTSNTNNSLPLSYQRGALGCFSFCKIQVAKQAQVRPTYTNTAYLRQSGAAQIGRGYYKDGNKFGYDAQKVTTGFAGGLIGAWAGFQAGVWVGFEGGFALGAAFGGIGAIPGAVTGGVIGGFGGAFGGAYYGGQFGTRLIKNKIR